MIHPINIQAGMVNKHVRLAPPVNALKIEGAEANACSGGHFDAG